MVNKPKKNDKLLSNLPESAAKKQEVMTNGWNGKKTIQKMGIGQHNQGDGNNG